MDLVIIGGTLQQQQQIVSELMSRYQSKVSHLNLSQPNAMARLINTNRRHNKRSTFVRLVTGVSTAAQVDILRQQRHTQIFHVYGPLIDLYNAAAIKPTDHHIATGDKYSPPHVLSPDEAYSECVMGVRPRACA